MSLNIGGGGACRVDTRKNRKDYTPIRRVQYASSRNSEPRRCRLRCEESLRIEKMVVEVNSRATQIVQEDCNCALFSSIQFPQASQVSVS